MRRANGRWTSRSKGKITPERDNFDPFCDEGRYGVNLGNRYANNLVFTTIGDTIYNRADRRIAEEGNHEEIDLLTDEEIIEAADAD